MMRSKNLKHFMVLALLASACEADNGAAVVDAEAADGAGGVGGAGAAGGAGGAGGVGGAGGIGGAGGVGGAGAAGGAGGAGGVMVDAAVADAAPPTPDAARPDPDMARPGPDAALPDPDMARPDPDMALPDPDMARPDPDMALPDPDMARPDPDMSPPDMAIVDDRLFSFFVTSLEGMRRLSGSQNGFGGHLGGLQGADFICQQLATSVGAGHKTWRAFLSATRGPDGQPVHAIERIGQGPWYDANGRLISQNLQGLLGERPAGDAATVNDLPDEHGLPLRMLGDSHDVLTGSNRQGRLNNAALASTCNDWTSADGAVGRNVVMCGHSWPRDPRSGRQWIADHTVRGCAPGVNLVQNGPGVGDCVGCGGGWGAIYCFALQP